MTAVESGYAAWLKSSALYATSTVAGSAAAWGTKGVNSDIISALSFEADGAAEASREAAFMKGPIVRDKCVVMGRRRDLMCKPVTVLGDRSGYEGGAVVFVIGYQENDDGTTTLTVLKRTFV